MPAQRILVVDDSPSLRRMIAACLRAGGYDVAEAADGDEAHAAAQAAPQEQPFGMLVTDQVMPGMDGLTLIRRLRATPRYAAMPILMLTTEADGQIRAQAREAGASGFLPKPFDPEQLMQSVAALLSPSEEG